MDQRLARVGLSFIAACVVALSLFVLMLSMVTPSGSEVVDDPVAIANFVRMDGRNEDTSTRSRQQAPQPPQPKTPQPPTPPTDREEHTSELQSRENLVCRLLLEKKNATRVQHPDQDDLQRRVTK